MAGLLSELRKRGMIDNVTSEDLEKKLSEQSLSFYVGFDPTAESMHVGQLAVFNLMSMLQKAGHRPLVLVGGATGMIGDPGGKSKERVLLSPEVLQQNVRGIQSQLQRFVEFSEAPNGAKLVNNQDWLAKWSYIDFLRDVGKHFSVNQMMQRDSVKARLERDGVGISYTEFSYMLLQAYDFMHLLQAENCQLQVGGSDQWGNIVSGIDLNRRLLSRESFGMTLPMVTKSDGQKFGKSEAGTVWLDPEKTSPYEFYQFFVRSEDRDVGRLLRVLTDVPLAEIEELEETLQQEAHKRLPHKRLAEALTQRVHGLEALQKVEQASQVIYGGAMDDLDDATISSIFSDVPSSQVEASVLEAGWPLIDALVHSGACTSKSQARKLVAGGGVYLNNKAVGDSQHVIQASERASESFLVLRTGKRNYRLVQVVR